MSWCWLLGCNTDLLVLLFTRLLHTRSSWMPWHLEEAYSAWSREKRGSQRKLRVGKAYLWRSKQRITASSTSSPPIVSAQVLLFQCFSTGCSLAEFLNNDVLQAATAWSWAISRHVVCWPEACRYHTHIIIFHGNWKRKQTWNSHYYDFHAEP
jgi:hypothetical protein